MVTVRRLAGSDVDPALRARIRELLDLAFSEGFSEDDWDHACGGRHVLVTDGDVLVAHAAVVPRTLEVGDRSFPAGYVEAVATAPDRQGQGFGSLAMTEVARILHEEYAVGALSTGRHSFYGRLGWERWLGPTFVNDGAERRRTEEDDDGVMVLRIGASRGVDLRAPVVCPARSGDDW